MCISIHAHVDSGPGGGREGEHRKSVVSVRNSMSRCVRVLDFEEEFHAVPSKPVRQGLSKKAGQGTYGGL